MAEREHAAALTSVALLLISLIGVGWYPMAATLVGHSMEGTNRGVLNTPTRRPCGYTDASAIVFRGMGPCVAQTSPVNGFWSLTRYNQYHFFSPNEITRYSLGTKNEALQYGADGSLTLYVQADKPPEEQRNTRP